MKDVIGSADMTTQGSLTSFSVDRFDRVNSALALNGSFTRVPLGVYFDTLELSISVWIYPMNVSSYSRIIDFGKGPSADNLVLALSSKNTSRPYFEFYSGATKIFSIVSAKQIIEINGNFLQPRSMAQKREFI